MCAEAGIEPIVTTTAQWGDEMSRTADITCCSPSDMADLIEYSWGNSTTPWGKMRISDGHPAPYQLRFIELGELIHECIGELLYYENIIRYFS